jgi:MoxR-like ATPase
MNQATAMYALGLDQVHKAILANGHKRTVLVQGHMGTGKSSLLKMLGSTLTNHVPCYFDCTTKDLGDITIPSLHTIQDNKDGEQCVKFVPNEELGVHLGKPIILMIDEYGKANPAVKNAMLRLILERQVGSYKLHPDSKVFATTNLGAEGVGDLLQPHNRNRITIVTSRKPTWREWIEWGINNGIDHTLLGWVKDNDALFASFEDIKNPDENEYIFHPKAVGRTSFVTPRSLEAASDWLKARGDMDDQTLTAVLMGTIGNRAAMDLMAFVRLADQLPSIESIKQDPMNAKVPTSAGALAMVVYRALGSIERDWIDSWVEYMGRLDAEAQGMFVNNVREEKYSRRDIVLRNKKFTEWAMKNNHMFAADKK